VQRVRTQRHFLRSHVVTPDARRLVLDRNGQRVPGMPRPRIAVAVVAASTVAAGVVATVQQAWEVAR
jgi:hypothetical protein